MGAMKRIGLLFLAMLCGLMSSMAQVYQIGDLYTAPDGSQGVVYWLNPDGSGGWVVALNDASTGCAWGTAGDVPGLDNRNPGSNNRQQLLTDTAGYANTQAIRSYQNNAANTAAGVVDFAHGWYLPSPAQLSILYGQLPFIEAALVASGGTAPATGNYWCSAEVDGDNAWYVIFSYGYFNSGGKTSSNRVRAVRSFTYPSFGTVAYTWSDGSAGSNVSRELHGLQLGGMSDASELECCRPLEQRFAPMASHIPAGYHHRHALLSCQPGGRRQLWK